ncbi:MAG: nickel-responsive transcriptional regulator NikR [Candidatus Margulisbacteria bacterium]|nr:nickel-responsive transcriptional regulator NikR [Candidatus Margulisiibacteriota bacterium]
MKERTQRFGVSMDDTLLKKLDAYIASKGYTNRSEAIRDFVRENLVEEEWKADRKQVVGTVTLIYDHAALELPKKLTDLQHHFHKEIISTTHIHLDEHNCLEILALKGKGEKVKAIADRLIAAKGVKHGKLVMSTTGKEIV